MNLGLMDGLSQRRGEEESSGQWIDHPMFSYSADLSHRPRPQGFTWSKNPSFNVVTSLARSKTIQDVYWERKEKAILGTRQRKKERLSFLILCAGTKLCSSAFFLKYWIDAVKIGLIDTQTHN